MIYPGTDLKFKVTAVMVGFDINEDNMTLLIKNRWGKTCYRYTADDFFEHPASIMPAMSAMVNKILVFICVALKLNNVVALQR